MVVLIPMILNPTKSYLGEISTLKVFVKMVSLVIIK